ncbi:MAG: TldD/PmbA family protein [Bacillota bacterium]
MKAEVDRIGDLLLYAGRQGADQCEVYQEESTNWNCRVYQGKVDDLQASRSGGLGVRLIYNNVMGTAYTTDLRWESMMEAVDRAIENAKIGHPDQLEFYKPDSAEYPKLSLWDGKLDSVSDEEKIRLALDMEKMAGGKDPRIQKVLGASVSTRSHKVTIRSTRDIHQSYRSNSVSANVSVLATKNGMMQAGHGYQFSRTWEGLNPGSIVDEAIEHAVSLVGGQPVESQDAAVIFQRGVAGQIWAMLGRTLTGEEAQKGRSIFAGRKGEKVASHLVTVIDDPLREDGPGASPFDGEGVPHKTFTIIENGVLQGFLYDTRSAAKADTKTTGHAHRTFRSAVSAAPANLYLKPGDMTRDELIAGTKNGFLVVEVKGLTVGGFNVVTGDLSVGASGLWLKDGKVVGPVREVTIAGNLKEMLMEVDGVADDFKWGAIGTPSFRVKKMAVSGK